MVLIIDSYKKAPLEVKEKTIRRNNSLGSLLSVLSFHETEQVPGKSWLALVMLRG